MKKFLLSCLLLIGCLFFVSAPFAVATATESGEAAKTYLISANYASTAANYGISNPEIKTLSRPFDYQTNQMMVGQSIMPTTTTKNQFNKTFTVSGSLTDSDSLFVYLFFSETQIHNLTIVLSDSSSNSLAWNISKESLMSEIVNDHTSGRVRFGWMFVELPVGKANKTGTITTISSMQFDYSSESVNDNVNYAQMLIYAPYVSQSTSEDILFSGKQNYYNFKIDFAQYCNKLCMGDTFETINWRYLFEYCILGDTDFLEYTSSNYQFGLEIIDDSYITVASFMFGEADIHYTFEKVGSYTFRIKLYKDDDPILREDQKVNIDEFVAAYLQTSLPDMIENEVARFKIYIGSLVSDYENISVSSSDKAVATVSLSDNKELVIESGRSGKTSITISIDANRENEEMKTYTYTYSLTVEEDTSTNWIGILFGAIGLIIGCVIVYYIMVKKRLINGKYPRY